MFQCLQQQVKKRKITKHSPYLDLIFEGKCSICNQKFMKPKASNIKRHFEREHNQKYLEIETQIKNEAEKQQKIEKIYCLSRYLYY
uniref:Uncharacterized protein n=1 Tax=Meloidogyne enterolobii TaxID=390850 RepID=A0A6V7Y4S0_MELEN|nr:unnamed protein product [Meloidogyne enterolobii]